MLAYRRCFPQLLRLFVALLVLLLSGFSAGQERIEVGGGQARRALEAQKTARDSIKLNHPGWTDSQVETLLDRVQAEFGLAPEKSLLKAPPLDGAIIDLGLSFKKDNELSERTAQRDHARALAGVRELLNSESASGWGYLGYDWVAAKSRLEEFRIGGLAGAPGEKAGKFLLVD